MTPSPSRRHRLRRMPLPLPVAVAVPVARYPVGQVHKRTRYLLHRFVCASDSEPGPPPPRDTLTGKFTASGNFKLKLTMAVTFVTLQCFVCHGVWHCVPLPVAA